MRERKRDRSIEFSSREKKSYVFAVKKSDSLIFNFQILSERVKKIIVDGKIMADDKLLWITSQRVVSQILSIYANDFE